MELGIALGAVIVIGAVGGLAWHRRLQGRLAALEAELAVQTGEVAELNQRIRRGLEGMGAALWEWRLTDDTIHLSDLFLQITGYGREEFGTSARQFFACFHPDERDEVRGELDDYMARRTVHCSAEVRFRRKDGHYVWMHLRAVGSWDAEGRPLSLVGSFTDITAKMEAEEERDRLFNLSTDMLAVGGFDEYLQQINPAWVRVLGWSRDELMGSPLVEFIHEDDREGLEEAWTVLRQGTPVEGLENRFRCRDGSFRWLSWGSFPYPDRQLVFSVVRDITLQKQSEHQLLEYQDRLRSLTSQLSRVEDRQRRELASAIHDGLAQQLFGIRAQMVLLKYPDKVPNLRDIVIQIIDILDDTMAEARSLSFELFPPVLYEAGLEAALVWLCHNFGERTGIVCACAREGEGPELPEDMRAMAYQCVRELMNNVNKHARAGRIDVTLNYVDRFLTILVEDDGAGFDPNRQERPQEAERSTSGFGLFSIRERLRSVSGRMLVDSKPGQGARIFLSFPQPGEGMSDEPVAAEHFNPRPHFGDG
ncbi:PAS domain-containing protein [bacterium]|nr:PAS domain-containing protein [bacterium]